MIEIDDKVVGLWFVGLVPKQDWMAVLSEIEPDQKYKLNYRFRYHLDDQPFDSKDKKSWWKAEISGTRNYCVSSLRLVANTLKNKAGSTDLYEVLNDTGNLREFLKKLDNMPFTFMRMEDKKRKDDVIDDEDGAGR